VRYDASSIASSIVSCYWKCYLCAKHARFLFCGIYISLSWIISCALRKVLFSKHIFCLKDCFGNYCEDWKKIYFQNISNLLKIWFVFILWVGYSLGSDLLKPMSPAIYMEGAKPNLVVVHAVLFLCKSKKLGFACVFFLWAFLVSHWYKFRTVLFWVVISVILS
jgi:hypothetical protein